MARDICKGFRECYNAVMKAVVSNAVITGVLMGIPSYYLITGLLMHGSVISYSPAYVSIANNASGPFFTLLGFTLLAWVIGCVSIKLMMPNVLGIMAFGHSAIGSWWLVNFAIIFIGGWSYIPAGIMMLILMGIIIPGIGGEVYARLGFGTQDDKNRYTPELVKQRRNEISQRQPA